MSIHEDKQKMSDAEHHGTLQESNEVQTKGTHLDLIKSLEGMENKAYYDTAQKVTVGIGFNMDTLYSKQIWDKLEIPEDFSLVYNGVSEISDESAFILFEHFWEGAEKQAKQRCYNIGRIWKNLPAWHKFILADIVYNTGTLDGWFQVILKTEPKEVLYEARRKQHEIDSRIAKIGYSFGLIDSLEEAHEIGLTEAKYLV